MPAQRKPQPRGEVVVNRVLDLTLKELAKVGLDALSIPHIAEKAGVNKTSIYRRWPTKEALVRAALEQPMDFVHTAIDTGSLEGDLVELTLRAGAFFESPRGLAAVRAVLARRGRADPTALLETQGLALREPLERALTSGELRGDLEPQQLLFTLAGALLHRALLERQPVDRAWARAQVRLLLDGARALQRTR